MFERRKRALFSQDAEDYVHACDFDGVYPEDVDLYERGLMELEALTDEHTLREGSVSGVEEKYRTFLERVENTGRTTSKFNYPVSKINALQNLGMRGLKGFGDFEIMLLKAQAGKLDVKAMVAVSSAYQKAIDEADKFMRDYKQ